jgi:hypothetical protein
MNDTLVTLLCGTRRKCTIQKVANTWYYDRNAWKCVTRYAFLSKLQCVKHIKARDNTVIYGAGTIGYTIFMLEFDILIRKYFISCVDTNGCIHTVAEIETPPYVYESTFIVNEWRDLILGDTNGTFYKYTIPHVLTSVSTRDVPLIHPDWKKSVCMSACTMDTYKRTILCAGVLGHIEVLDVRTGGVMAIRRVDQERPVAVCMGSSNSLYFLGSLNLIGGEKFIIHRKFTFDKSRDLLNDIMSVSQIHCDSKLKNICEIDGVVFMGNWKNCELLYYRVDNPVVKYIMNTKLKRILFMSKHDNGTLLIGDSHNVLLMKFQK